MKGILIGLAAALLQSLSYLLSAAFVRAHSDRRNPSLALLARSYIAMGVVSALVLLLFLRHYGGRIPPLSDWLVYAVLGIVTAMVAQGAMFFTLRAADASRVSPLIGIKIFFLALMGMVFAGDTYTPLQWGAIAMTLLSAHLLSRNGGRLGAAGIVGVLVTSLSFAASDYTIRLQQAVFHAHAAALQAQGLDPVPLVTANLAIVWLDYALGGAVGLLLLPWTERYPARVWVRHVLPYAAVWLGAICVLLVSFDMLGVVLGTIVQNTRGILSIGLGYLLARVGGTALEQRLGRRDQLVRLAAGLLMFLAIAAFALG